MRLIHGTCAAAILAAMSMTAPLHAGPAFKAPAASPSADVFRPKGAGPVVPFRESAVGSCANELCSVAFSKVPNKTQLIVNTFTCFSNVDANSNHYSVIYTGANPETGFVAFMQPAPQLDPENLTFGLTGTAVPFKAGQVPRISIGGEEAGGVFCSLIGTHVPVD